MSTIAPRAAAGTLACAILALSTAPLAFGASGDRLSGSGRLTVGAASLWISVSARSGPSGEDPSGTLRIDRTGTHTLSGIADALCLKVVANEATTVGRLRLPVANPNEPGTTYQYILVSVTDNGEPGGGIDTFNSGVTWGTPGDAPVPSCSGFLGGSPSEAGNFTVVDVAP